MKIKRMLIASSRSLPPLQFNLKIVFINPGKVWKIILLTVSHGLVPMPIADGKKRGCPPKQNGRKQQEEQTKEFFPGETNSPITAGSPLEENLVKKDFR